VLVTAEDKDGGISDGYLIVGGSAEDDTIELTLGSIVVTVNGVQTATVDEPVGRIAVFGLAGDDSITVDPSLVVAVGLHGGPGNDTLIAGGGATVLDGGAF